MTRTLTVDEAAQEEAEAQAAYYLERAGSARSHWRLSRSSRPSIAGSRKPDLWALTIPA